MSSAKPSRRRFLKGAAGASLALPFFTSLEPRSSLAAPPANKKRILFIYLPHQETTGFAPDASFSFASSYLSPLATNHKSRMLVLNNMKTKGQGHGGGHSEWLTGYPGGDDARPQPTQGPSLDVYLAKRLDGQTPLPQLNFTTSWRSALNVGVTSWNEGANPTAIPGINDPVQAFTAVYGTSGGSGTPTQPDRALVLRASLLDALQKDYARINGKLSTGDRRLLDQHLTLVRDQEKRLQRSIQTPFSCTGSGGAPAKGLGLQDGLKSFMDSIIGAFRCDATRVATLSLGACGDDSSYTFVDAGAKNYHDDVAHGNASLIKKIRQWQFQQIAYLCDQMAAVPDGDGTLLDHTLIACLPELGWFPDNGILTYTDASGRMQTTDNNHLRFQVPAVLIGSSGGFFATGRYVDMKQAHYHNLLLTFAHAMGFTDVTRFGESGTAVLTQLRA
jgi:hypothetical protein